MQYVVVLVHGTWAGRAAWMDGNSPLCKALNELSGTVVVRRFRWSGRNSVKARFEAAGLLRDHLASLLEEFPGARHVVIAHSHGGSIVLYALLGTRFAQRLWGIACLATPFLYVRERLVARTPRDQLDTDCLAAIIVVLYGGEFSNQCHQPLFASRLIVNYVL